MSKSIYVDSCIFLNWLLNETKQYQVLYTEQFFRDIDSCLYSIVISDLVLKEVHHVSNLDFKIISQLLERFKRKDKLKLIVINKELDNRAKEICRKYNLHYSDALHVTVAEFSNCDFLVSWNLKDFSKTNLIVSSTSPKYL